MGKARRSTFTILTGKPTGKRPLGKPKRMNEFSQTSLKGQGLLLLEQVIARVCSKGEQVL